MMAAKRAIRHDAGAKADPDFSFALRRLCDLCNSAVNEVWKDSSPIR
jgi:hypothetical protein